LFIILNCTHNFEYIPSGLKMRINAIAAYIVIKASSGKKTFPKVSIKPMSSEPTKAI